jgi:uncharacterized protein
MVTVEAPRTFLWVAVFAVLSLFGGPVVEVPSARAEQAATTLPEFENEFFNDFSGSVSNAQKIEISRNLRLASESSQIHSMIVVIRRVADYPGLPREVHPMAVQLARERKIGSQKTHQGLLALFALEDRKFTVANSDNVSPKLAESIRDAFNGRVRARLKDGQIGQALVFASEDLASLLPKAGAAPRAVTQGFGSSSGSVQQRAAPSAPEQVRPEVQKSLGWGWGTWIAVLFGGYVLLSLLGRLFSGGGGAGGFGGGSPGWGGLLGGLLGGGLLGYWLGNSSSHASDSQQNGGVLGDGDGGSHGGSDSSDSGGFDSFGGGDFGGGGSDGDW